MKIGDTYKIGKYVVVIKSINQFGVSGDLSVDNCEQIMNGYFFPFKDYSDFVKLKDSEDVRISEIPVGRKFIIKEDGFDNTQYKKLSNYTDYKGYFYVDGDLLFTSPKDLKIKLI